MEIDLPTPPVIDALARLLGVPEGYVLEGFRAAREGRYHSFDIPKGNGKVRRIDAPARELKALQRIILERLLSRGPISPFAHGFVKGRSIVTNGFAHLATARALVSVDLEDAYPSVSAERVRESLEQALGRYVKDAIPREYDRVRDPLFAVLAAICTHEGRLPQGAPTSGTLLNFACARLDRLAAKLVRKRRRELPHLRYTRYADDLTFTASAPFPEDFVEDAVRAILRSGFRPNRRKIVRTDERHGAIVVCGVRLAGDRLALPRKKVRRLRALFHRMLDYRPDDVPEPVRAYLTGSLGFLTMVTPACPRMLEAPLAKLVERHGSWLRPSLSAEIHYAPLPYGG